VIGPELQPLPLKIEQTAPGRYIGTFPARQAGSYFLTISPGPGQAPIRSGVNVPYSDEFRDRSTNEALLAQLAATVPEGGPAGRILPALGADKMDSLLAVNTFRHDLPKRPAARTCGTGLLVVAACVLLGDVFVRRVHVGFGWVPDLSRWSGQPPVAPPGPAPAPIMERLAQPQGPRSASKWSNFAPPPGWRPRRPASSTPPRPEGTQALDDQQVLARPAPQPPTPPPLDDPPSKHPTRTVIHRVSCEPRKKCGRRNRIADF